MSVKLTVDEIMNQHDQQSDLSVSPSFTLQDILNEQQIIDSDDQADIDDIFEESDEEEISDTKPSKRSDTAKSVSVYEASKVPLIAIEVQRTSRIKATPLKQQILAKNITYTPLHTVSAAFDTSNKMAKGVALPNCVYSTSSKFLAIGTTLSNIALFQVGIKDFRILKDDGKAHSQGKPMSIVISDDNKWLVAGFEAGSVTVWDLMTMNPLKTVASLVADSPTVIKVLFWKGNSDFLSLDSSGNVTLHTIEKYIWTGVRSRNLFQNTVAVYNDARVTTLQNGHIHLALANVDFVYIIKLDPAIEVVTKVMRPAQINSNKIPNIEFGKGRTYEYTSDVLLVSWGKIIFVYKYNSLNRGDAQYELEKQFTWKQPIFCMQMLVLNMLLVLDNKNTFRIINISQDIEKGAIKNETCLEQDLFAQRTNKDKTGQFIKNYSNSISKCTKDFKEVFLLTKNNVIRGRLHRWTEFIRYLIQQKQWDQILKASIEIFFGRMDIFAEKVVITPTTVLLFNELVTVYMKSRLDELLDKRSPVGVIEQVQEVMDTVIEFCLQLKLHKQLFEGVFDLVSGEYNLAEEFIESLGNFISLNLITEIPSRFVLNAIIEYYVIRRVELVDKLIANLRPESIDYQATIEVCSKHKLFYSLMYVSQLNADFIAPLNKILRECRQLSDDGYSNERLQNYLQLIYGFISNVLQGKTITGVPMIMSLHDIGTKKIVVWYLIRENAEFLIRQNAAQYFQILTLIMLNPLVCELSDKITLTISLVEYMCESISGAIETINNEKYRKLFSEALICINKVWEMQGGWLLYALNHLKQNCDMVALTDFIHRNLDKIQQSDTEKQYLRVLPREIMAEILYYKGRSAEAITLYRQLNDNSATERFFKMMSEQCLLANVRELMLLNVNLTGEAIHNRLRSQTIDHVVDQLEQNVYKYELMRVVSRLDKTGDIRWRQSNSLFYLRCICTYRSEKRAYYELKKRDFNILEALKIVHQRNFKLCEAYLEEINCQTLRAFELYCELYIEYFRADLDKMLRFKYVNGRQLQKAYSGAVRMLNSLPFMDGEYYLKLFEVVFKPLSESAHKKTKLTVAQQIDEIFRKKGRLHQQFSKTFTEIVCQTIGLISSAVTPVQMKVLIDQHLNTFTGVLMQQRLRLTLAKQHRNMSIIKGAETVTMQDTNNTLRTLMQKRSKAVGGSPSCSLCQRSLVLNDVVVFPCGCSIHEKCAQAAGTAQCPACKLRHEPHARELRKRLRLQLETPKKDMRKSSVSLVDNSQYFSYMSFDKAVKEDEQKRYDYLMSDI